MIELEAAHRLLLPLWKLFPRTADEPDYQDLIAKTLVMAGRDEEHAKAVVSSVLLTCSYRPVPADIQEAANQLAAGSERQPAIWTGLDYRCSRCQDTGWIAAGENTSKRCPDCKARAPSQQELPLAEGAKGAHKKPCSKNSSSRSKVTAMPMKSTYDT